MNGCTSIPFLAASSTSGSNDDQSLSSAPTALSTAAQVRIVLKVPTLPELIRSKSLLPSDVCGTTPKNDAGALAAPVPTPTVSIASAATATVIAARAFLIKINSSVSCFPSAPTRVRAMGRGLRPLSDPPYG